MGKTYIKNHIYNSDLLKETLFEIAYYSKTRKVRKKGMWSTFDYLADFLFWELKNG